MESEVRRLFIEYGVKNVMNCMNAVSKALYEELKEIYGETVPVNTVETVEAPPAEKKERRLRIVKKAVEPVEAPVETAVEPVATNEKVVEVVTLRVKKKAVPPVEVQQSGEEDSEENEDEDSDTTVPIDVPATYRVKTAEEIRKERDEHLAAVAAKHAELVNKNISPKTLLTRENLEKWLKSGISYQRIARDHVGLSERYIAGVAKNYGLKSNIAEVMRLRRMRGYM